MVVILKKDYIKPLPVMKNGKSGLWYVASMTPSYDKTVQFYLRLNKFRHYMPMNFIGDGEYVEGEKRYKCARSMRLFPGYVFIKFNILRDRWQEINNYPGIGKLLPIKNEQPTALPRYFIGQLHDDVTRGVFKRGMEDQFIKRFIKGETVAVTSGPFEQCSGKFVRQVKGSVTLMMYLFGGKREISVPIHQVQ